MREPVAPAAMIPIAMIPAMVPAAPLGRVVRQPNDRVTDAEARQDEGGRCDGRGHGGGAGEERTRRNHNPGEKYEETGDTEPSARVEPG